MGVPQSQQSFAGHSVAIISGVFIDFEKGLVLEYLSHTINGSVAVWINAKNYHE